MYCSYYIVCIFMRLCVFILDMNSLSSNSALSETRAKLCLLQIFTLYSMGDNVTSDSEIG
jgi:hypothetical protein